MIDNTKIVVFETTDSLQNETPSALYMKYNPAKKIINPSSQMILLVFICISRKICTLLTILDISRV